MVKISISETQIMKLLKQGLVLLGYPDGIEVQRYITDNNKPRYYFYYLDDCGNNYIKTFGIKDTVNILQNMMIINRCEKSDFDISVKDGNVNYFVKMNTITNNKKRIKKR